MSRALATAAKEESKIVGIVRQMMFVYGDGEEPLPACEAFVLDLTKHQLLMLLEKAYETSQAAKSKVIRLSDLLLQFRRHKSFLNRLFKYAQAAHSVIQVSAEASSDQDEEVESGKSKKVGGALAEILAAAASVGIDVDTSTIETLSDPVLDLRNRRLASRVSSLSTAQYERFSNARKAGFSNGANKKGTKKPRDPFFLWLGSPPIGSFVGFVLAFVAREVVAHIVDDALTVREQETPDWFRDEGQSGAIQLRHYEQAIRRNFGFRRQGDFLFGYN